MNRSMPAPPILVLGFLITIYIAPANCNEINHNGHVVGCRDSEKQALLGFKQGLEDPSNRLSSWNIKDDNCCNWAGVVCNNITGHVIELHLQNPNYYGNVSEYLRGKMNPSLLNQKHLRYLNLSDNDFGSAPIPSSIGSLASLQYLDLSNSGFEGTIPPQLGNLTSLRFLSLYGTYQMDAQNLDWLPGLSQLEHLDLSYVNLTMAPNWVEVINKLPFLVELQLRFCRLDGIYNKTHGVVNFTSLAVLDLSYNHFDGFRIPKWIFSLRSLVSLDLSDSGFLGWPQDSIEMQHEFEGPFSAVFQNMTSLRHLDISSNEIEERLPSFPCNLTSMDLSFNKFHGELFMGSSKCPIYALESLILSENRLSGRIPDKLEQFKNLQYLHLTNNLLSGPIPMDLGKLTSLEFLDLTGNQLNGSLPKSLGNLPTLQELDISDNLLEGIVISEVHFANLTNLIYLHASRNRFLKLKVSPNWVPPFQLQEVSLASWHLGPEFPKWIQSQKQLRYVDLSSCGIVDGIPTWFWNFTSSLRYVNLSDNQLHGGIPYIPLYSGFRKVYLGSNQLSGSLIALDLSNNSFSGSILHFLCDGEKELVYLNLENNRLSGEIPDCWMNFSGLGTIQMGNNHLTGNIPSSIFRLPYLQSLHLRKNHLFGEIFWPLQNWTHLKVVDLSENELTGNILTRIGERLSNLKVLCLRSNRKQA